MKPHPVCDLPVLDIDIKPNSPERELLLAVLQRAMIDFLYPTTVDAYDAEAWLFGEGEYPLSFRDICAELGLPHATLRRWLRSAWEDEDQRALAAVRNLW